MNLDDIVGLRERLAGLSCPEPNTGCWLWTGSTNWKGYGQITIRMARGVYRNMRAHRVSFMAFLGELGDEKMVCHRCDTPACINPDHLYAGTAQDNTRDALERGRVRVGERHQNTKHSDGLVRRAVEMVRSGTPPARVGQILSVLPQTVKGWASGTYRGSAFSDPLPVAIPESGEETGE